MAFWAVPSKEVTAALPYDTFIKSLRFQIEWQTAAPDTEFSLPVYGSEQYPFLLCVL